MEFGDLERGVDSCSSTVPFFGVSFLRFRSSSNNATDSSYNAHQRHGIQRGGGGSSNSSRRLVDVTCRQYAWLVRQWLPW